VTPGRPGRDRACDLTVVSGCKLGLEGIVSKRLGSPYRSGRSKDWLKFKNPMAGGEARGRGGVGQGAVAVTKPRPGAVRQAAGS
jgi:hypothetical protein